MSWPSWGSWAKIGDANVRECNANRYIYSKSSLNLFYLIWCDKKKSWRINLKFWIQKLSKLNWFVRIAKEVQDPTFLYIFVRFAKFINVENVREKVSYFNPVYIHLLEILKDYTLWTIHFICRIQLFQRPHYLFGANTYNNYIHVQESSLYYVKEWMWWRTWCQKIGRSWKVLLFSECSMSCHYMHQIYCLQWYSKPFGQDSQMFESWWWMGI